MNEVAWKVEMLVGGVLKTYTQDDLAAFLAEVPNAVAILAEAGIVVTP